MTTNSATKVRFKIISCSSEDPQYPATELLQPSPQGKGWQSARFCDYPQEIIIQFLAPVRLKQVQFLCHQCKIPSKIELFSFIQDLNSVMPNTEFKWTKLGFLSLDPNDKSGYQARELKSVFLDIPALFLRFYFHKCHMNKYNLFNQVALVAVSVFGEPLTKDVLDRPTKAQQKYEKLGFTTHYDKFILERLTLLEDAKDVAVKAEDYKEAKRLKDAIDRLKFIATKIQDLETQKELAIQNEDYDQARSIKEEIERIKQSINPNEHIKPIEEQEQKTVIMYFFQSLFFQL